MEVKRAIPRSRIGSNGSILPPSAAQVRPSNQAVPPSPARPVESAAPTGTATGQGAGTGQGTGTGGGIKTHPAPANAAAAKSAAAASASKVRQDMRRSASMGAPPTTAPAKSGRPGQQSLAASIAGIGVPSPRAKVGTATTNSVVINVPPVVSRVAAGSTYAAALRTGAVAEDSETSITDQMLIAGLQSDLLQAQSSTSSMLYGGLFSDSHSHAPISVIERPPRSFSEPVIQLPQKMGSDYFKNQLSLIQGRGVAALGGAFNPVSPLLTSFGSISPSQKAVRSPVMTALASPLLPLPPLGLAWLSTSPTKTSDASIIETPASATTTTAATDFFLPLPSTASTMNNLLPEATVGQQQQQQHQQQMQQQLLSRQQDFQHLQYMQQQFLQQQMQQMQQQQAYYQSQGLGLINQTLVNQQQMGIQLINGQPGLYTTQNTGQGVQQNQVEGIPSPLAWASMVSVPQQVQGQQQYFEPLLQQGYQQGQGFYTTQQPMTQQQYFQQQQYHIQMQQHLQQSGQYSINSMGMVMPPGGAVAFSTPLQSQQFMSVPYIPQGDVSQIQSQVPVQTQAAGTVRNGSTTSAAGNSVGLGVGGAQAVGVGAVLPGSGAASRSGSFLPGSVASSAIGAISGNDSVSNGDVSSSGSGSASGAADKDELFLYEGLRLDGDAPEFEPQAARGW